MRLLIFVGVFILSSQSFAARHAFTALGSMERSTLNIGANYDVQFKKSYSLGVGLWYGTENAQIGRRSGFYIIDGTAKFYFGSGRTRLYVAPGFGISNFPKFSSYSAGGSEHTMVMGMVLKIGALYRVTKSFSIGAEYLNMANWMEEDAVSTFRIVNLALRFEF